MNRLERQCSTAAHWTEQQYWNLCAPEGPGRGLALIALQQFSSEQHAEKSPICGFLVARSVPPEWELENIVVAPESRGQGIGTGLIEELLARAQQVNSDAVFLEVRESNAAARALYEKLGFQQTGRRKSYYANPIEDAIVYLKRPPFAPTLP